MTSDDLWLELKLLSNLAGTFLYAKYEQVFKALDRGKGYVVQEDLNYGSQLVKFLNLDPTDPKAKALLDYEARNWTEFFGKFDADRDGKVTKEEFFQGIEACSDLSEVSAENAKFMFHVFDTNNDGIMSIDEFHVYLRSFNTDDKEFAQFVFEQIDENKDNQLSLDEFVNFNVRFHTSTDEKCPSRYYFGKIHGDDDPAFVNWKKAKAA
jgi:Ca2+-binding EF-hand superfamily protein